MSGVYLKAVYYGNFAGCSRVCTYVHMLTEVKNNWIKYESWVDTKL